MSRKPRQTDYLKKHFEGIEKSLGPQHFRKIYMSLNEIRKQIEWLEEENEKLCAEKFAEVKNLTYALRTEIDHLKGFPKSFRWFLTNIIYDVECHIRGDFPITSEDGYVFSFVNSNYRKVLRDKNLWKDPMKKNKKGVRK